MTGKLTIPEARLDALPLGAHRLYALTDEVLFEACGVRVAFTGRAGGVSEGEYAELNMGSHVGDDPAAVEENRRLVLEALGAGGGGGADCAPFIVPNQVHGTNVVALDDVSEAAAVQDAASEGADGVVVRTPGVAVLLNYADCLSLIVVSPSGRFVVAHAGWRGAVAHIAAKAARVLADGDACPLSEYNAYIGPHIRQECFEVGEKVADRFREEFGEDVVAYPDGSSAAKHVNLAQAVALDLQRAGLDTRRIADCGICTKCNPDQYFSYRATDGHCGRHAAAAYRRWVL